MNRLESTLGMTDINQLRGALKMHIRVSDRLAYQCARLIMAGHLGSRSGVADALLDYLQVGQPGGPGSVPEWVAEYEQKQKDKAVKYSFCESNTATSISPWCVRRLTAAGPKLGGGVDSASLCGRVKESGGWDLSPPVDLNHPKICKKCADILKKEKQ